MTTEVRVIPLEGIPEIEEDDDLAALLLAAAESVGGFEDADVLVVAQKAVSKAEGRVVRLDDVEPSPRALESQTTATRATSNGSCARAPTSSACGRR